MHRVSSCTYWSFRSLRQVAIRNVAPIRTPNAIHRNGMSLGFRPPS